MCVCVCVRIHMCVHVCARETDRVFVVCAL